MIQPATIAALLARGCPDELLADAYEWLERQPFSETINGILAQLDEAIAVAHSMHDPRDE